MDFDKLFDDMYPKLYRYCLRMAPDPDLAEDAAQEAFVRLVERKVDGEAAGVRAWLFRVATNFLRDGARVDENRRRLLHETGIASPPPPRPEEATERLDSARLVRRALERMSDRDRQLLLMREEGFSYRELAEVVGVEGSSIGTLLVRARREFEKQVGSLAGGS